MACPAVAQERPPPELLKSDLLRRPTHDPQISKNSISQTDLGEGEECFPIACFAQGAAQKTSPQICVVRKIPLRNSGIRKQLKHITTKNGGFTKHTHYPCLACF